MKKNRLVIIPLVLLLLMTGCSTAAENAEKAPMLSQAKNKELPPTYLYTLSEKSGGTLSKYLDSGELVSTAEIGMVQIAVQSRESDAIYYTDLEGTLYLRSTDGSVKKLVDTDDGRFSIYNGALYYLKNGAVVKSTLAGEGAEILLDGCKQLCGVAGNSLYVEEESSREIYEYNVKTQVRRKLTTGAETFYALLKDRLITTEQIGGQVEVFLTDLTTGTSSSITLPGMDFTVVENEIYYSDLQNGDYFTCINSSGEQKRVICEKRAKDIILVGDKIYFSNGDYRGYTRYDVKTGQMTELPTSFSGVLISPLEQKESAGTATKSATKK